MTSPTAIKVRGHIVVQYESYGLSDEQKIESFKNDLVPSARALAKAANLLKALSSGDKPKTDPSEVNKTTVSYPFEIGLEDAIRLLNSFDSGKVDTPDFESRLKRFRDKQDEVGDVASLNGKQKVEALSKLRPFAFEGYSVQILINLPGEVSGTGKTEVFHSRKHRRLKKFVGDNVEALLSKFESAAIVDETEKKAIEPASESGEDQHRDQYDDNTSSSKLEIEDSAPSSLDDGSRTHPSDTQEESIPLLGSPGSNNPG